MRDYRVEPMRPDDLSKFLLPAAGIATFAVLAGGVKGLWSELCILSGGRKCESCYCCTSAYLVEVSSWMRQGEAVFDDDFYLYVLHSE